MTERMSVGDIITFGEDSARFAVVADDGESYKFELVTKKTATWFSVFTGRELVVCTGCDKWSAERSKT